MEKDLYQKIQDYQALDCIRHEGQKLEFIILDQRKHLEPLCYDCIEENEQFKESDFKMQNIHYVLRSLLSSAQSIDSRIQELMANETLWFQNMNEQFAALIKRIQEQMDKIKIVGENSINKLQSLQEKGKSVEKLVEKFLDSNSQDEQYAVCQEIDNYIQIKNDNKIKIKNDYYRNSKKMQNFKFITQNTHQLIDNVLQNNIEQINDELKNFDFTFVKSTFENSQEIKEIIPGREFLGQSLKGYQRIYSSIAFQNQIQQVDFSFTQSGKNLVNFFEDNCFVVGIRQDSIKDNGITLIGSMLKQKDYARYCLTCQKCSFQDNMEYVKDDRSRNELITPLGQEYQGRIQLDIEKNTFEIYDDTNGRKYQLKNKFKLKDQSEKEWVIYFQFKGCFNLKISQTYNVQREELLENTDNN